MDLNTSLFPSALAWLVNVLAAAFLAMVLRRAPWGRLAGIERANGWLLTAGCIAMIWAMRAEISSGLNLHLSGAALFALVHGWRLAIVGMALVCIAMTVAGHIVLVNLGSQFFLDAVLPVSVAYAVFLLSEAHLPRNFFVYIFVPAFFGAWITMVVLAMATSAVLAASGAYTWQVLGDAFLPFFVILGFSEAFITGFVITLLVVYKPQWVYTFRDERYITGK